MTNTMSHCAGETADVLLAADALPADSLQMMLSVFAGLTNKCDGYSPYERELFHSVTRLLARIRDIHAEHDRALRRADRQTRLRKTSTANEALKAEFDAVVNN